MGYVAALALLAIAAKTPQQPAAPPAGAFMLFGKPVVPQAPAVGLGDYAPEVKSWAGWGPLTGKPVKPFFVDGDWSSILTAPTATNPDAAAVPWRVKVILISSVDFLSPDASGNLVERRSGIYQPTRDRIAQGLALAGATLQAETAGRLAVSFDTTEDSALYEETVAEGAGLGRSALQAYVTPRINGGSFEANDKLYHGPYHLCLVIHAGLARPAQCEASGTTVFGLPAPADDASVSTYAVAVLRAFQYAAGQWSRRQGHEPPARGEALAPLANAFGDQPLDQVVADAGFGPVSGRTLVDGIKAGTYGSKMYSGASVQIESPVSANAQLAIVQDAEKGPVLSLKLSGVFPTGGFGLPLPNGLAATAHSANHVLVFDVRAGSPNVLGIGATEDGVLAGPGVALGQRANPGPMVAVPNDGAWHKVAVDLSLMNGNSGDLSDKRVNADHLYIGFLRDAQMFPKSSIQITDYGLANFSLVAAAPGDALTVTPSAGLGWEARAKDAREAAKADATPDRLTALTLALADPDESVRLNVLDALAANKAPGIEDKIAACMGTVNPRISEGAIAALAFQDTPAAWATLQQALRVGPGTHARVVSAGFIAQRKDPASAGQISALQTAAARDWHDRVATAKALAQNGTPQAQIFLRGFLDDNDDAGVRATAVDLISVGDDAGMNRLKFVSVNDPSDAVRAAAAIKLMQSGSTDTKHEGYRGANDDSWWVRVVVLDWIAAHPTADDRPALRQAIASPFGQVRAAALRAFTASSEPVGIEEIANVLNDLDPSVQREVIRLANAKKLVLPPDSVATLRGSISPEVAAAANSLPGS